MVRIPERELTIRFQEKACALPRYQLFIQFTVTLERIGVGDHMKQPSPFKMKFDSIRFLRRLKPDVMLMVYREQGNNLSCKLKSRKSNNIIVERRNQALDFPICEIGETVRVRGFDGVEPFYFTGTVSLSTPEQCGVNGLLLNDEHQKRRDFRYEYRTDILVYETADTTMKGIKKCTLVNISSSGACFESDTTFFQNIPLNMIVGYLGEVDATTLTGEIVRKENSGGRFRYGFQFVKNDNKLLDQLIQTLHDIEMDRKRNF